MIGLISGSVTAAARSLGHTISFAITGLLMLVVGVMLYNSASYGPRSYVEGTVRRFGPFLVFCLAVPLIMADLTRHLLQDSGMWPECGNNPYYSRANSTDPFPPSCAWSSAQYRCTVPCCVPVWQKLESSSGTGARTYTWSPPTSSLFPTDRSAPQFATLNADGSIYFPPEFNNASQPYRVFTAPLAFYDDGSHMEWHTGDDATTAKDCPYGLNADSGLCYLYANSSAISECSCNSCQPHEDIAHLSPIGWLFTIVFTYLGFTCLAVAVLWNANLIAKLKGVSHKWAELRRVQVSRG